MISLGHLHFQSFKMGIVSLLSEDSTAVRRECEMSGQLPSSEIALCGEASFAAVSPPRSPPIDLDLARAFQLTAGLMFICRTRSCAKMEPPHSAVKP
jgi:hypothetical protein